MGQIQRHSSSLGKAIYTATHWQVYGGSETWKKHFCKEIGVRFKVGNDCTSIAQTKYCCQCMSPTLRGGRKESLAPMWARLRKKIDLEDPTTFIKPTRDALKEQQQLTKKRSELRCCSESRREMWKMHPKERSRIFDEFQLIHPNSASCITGGGREMRVLLTSKDWSVRRRREEGRMSRDERRGLITRPTRRERKYETGEDAKGTKGSLWLKGPMLNNGNGCALTCSLPRREEQKQCQALATVASVPMFVREPWHLAA